MGVTVTRWHGEALRKSLHGAAQQAFTAVGFKKMLIAYHHGTWQASDCTS
jgi:hypothetical protein